MSILSGYEKYKRHLKIDDENYKLVSEWTHADTVEMSDGSSLTQKIDNMSAQTDALVGNEYDSTAIYSIGDYCTYNGKWYRCIVEITEAEEWNESHWTATNVSNEVDIIKSLGQYVRYNQTNGILEVYIDDNWVDGASVGREKYYMYRYGHVFNPLTGGFIFGDNITKTNSSDGLLLELTDSSVANASNSFVVLNEKINPFSILCFNMFASNEHVKMTTPDGSIIDLYGEIKMFISSTPSLDGFIAYILELPQTIKEFAESEEGSVVGTDLLSFDYDGLFEATYINSFTKEPVYIGFVLSAENGNKPTLLLREVYAKSNI